MGSAYQFPRSVRPSQVEIGDTIKVTHKKDRGLEMSLTGTVGKRMDTGATRYMMTAEGATLFAWDGKENTAIHILLLHRAEVEQTPLPLFESPELRERLDEAS